MNIEKFKQLQVDLGLYRSIDEVKVTQEVLDDLMNHVKLSKSTLPIETNEKPVYYNKGVTVGDYLYYRNGDRDTGYGESGTCSNDYCWRVCIADRGRDEEIEGTPCNSRVRYTKFVPEMVGVYKIETNRWYKIREKTKGEFLRYSDDWIRRYKWDNASKDRYLFRVVEKKGSPYFHILGKFESRVWTVVGGEFGPAVVAGHEKMVGEEPGIIRAKSPYYFTWKPHNAELNSLAEMWIQEYSQDVREVLGIGKHGTPDGALIRWTADDPARQLFSFIDAGAA